MVQPSQADDDAAESTDATDSAEFDGAVPCQKLASVYSIDSDT